MYQGIQPYEPIHVAGAKDKTWTLTPEYLLQPHMIGIFCSCIILLIGAAGVVVSVNLRQSRASTASPSRKSGAKRSSFDRNVKLVRDLFNTGLGASWKKFWKKLPRRIWNFYIECFIIPKYRNEWGKYKIWSYRSRERPKRSKSLSKEIAKVKKRKEMLEKLQTSANPAPIPHNHNECKRIRINVNGVIYETQLRTLNKFPDTLLGDPERRIKYYDGENDFYFFDRNRLSFESILYFYQSGGRFRRPENIHLDVFLDDAEFYQIPPAVMQNFRFEEGLIKDETETEVPVNLLLRKIWLLFDYPESSSQARILAFISIVSVVLSIAIFCIETLPDFTGKQQAVLANGKFETVPFDGLDLFDPIFFTETICSVWFTLEFVARFLSSPHKIAFLKGVLNLIDLIAIIPYFLTIATVKGSQIEGTTASLSILRVIRLVRVFRIFKLSRHSKGLKILGRTLHASLSELFLLVFFVFIGIILFSSTMYFAEQEELNTNFTSIPAGFWWAVITMTTVGYGDIFPVSIGGKIVGSLCAIAGVLTIALPVPVIVSNFNYFYHQAIDEQEFNWTKINHVSDCPYRPGGYYNITQGRPPSDDDDSEEFEELKYVPGQKKGFKRK